MQIFQEHKSLASHRIIETSKWDLKGVASTVDNINAKKRHTAIKASCDTNDLFW
jgi:hypothetical protein